MFSGRSMRGGVGVSPYLWGPPTLDEPGLPVDRIISHPPVPPSRLGHPSCTPGCLKRSCVRDVSKVSV